jgi:hypothetical protein
MAADFLRVVRVENLRRKRGFFGVVIRSHGENKKGGIFIGQRMGPVWRMRSLVLHGCDHLGYGAHGKNAAGAVKFFAWSRCARVQWLTKIQGFGGGF